MCYQGFFTTPYLTKYDSIISSGKTEVNPPRITAKLVFSLSMLLSCFQSHELRKHKQASFFVSPVPTRGARQTLHSYYTRVNTVGTKMPKILLRRIKAKGSVFRKKKVVSIYDSLSSAKSSKSKKLARNIAGLLHFCIVHSPLHVDVTN